MSVNRPNRLYGSFCRSIVCPLYRTTHLVTIYNYNIASRATQSNSIYVRELKIPRERPLLVRGKILYFGTIMDTNRDSAHQSQNEDNLPTFSLGLEFLNEAEKENRHQHRYDSLHSPRVKCNQTNDKLVCFNL